MKKVYQVYVLLLTLSQISLEVCAQAPKKMSYQAVIRNNTELVVNKQVGMRISILHGSADGNIIYSELHTPVSNSNGLVTFEIGAGSVQSGNFREILWAPETSRSTDSCKLLPAKPLFYLISFLTILF